MLSRSASWPRRWRIQDHLNRIQSDLLKIRQVFLNLISNAIKYTEQGSITVSAFDTNKGVLLSIADTGIGIKKEDLSTIFDPFRRIDGSLIRKVGGSGLGLTIVKNILEALHGSIEVQSKFGKGSTGSAEGKSAWLDYSIKIYSLGEACLLIRSAR